MVQVNANASSSTHIGCLVMNVALGREGKTFQRRQEHFLNHCGTEYTCKRAKAIWNVAVLLKNGDVEAAIDVCQENSIAHSPHTGYPKGIEGYVVKRYVEAQRPAVIKRLAAALRWYTSLRLTEASKAQISKSLNAITGKSTSVLSKEEIFQMGERHIGYAIEAYAERQLKPKPGETPQEHEYRKQIRMRMFLQKVQDIIKPVRYANTLKCTSKYYSRNKVPDQQAGIPYSSMAMSFMTEPWVPDVLDKRTPCAEMRAGIRSQEGWSNDDQAFAGKISFLQEQGCKARVVAQPSAWLQLAFVPLHDTMDQVAEMLFPESSCVHHQSYGAEMMRYHQLDGNPTYCTDLTSATDRFPVEYTYGVLHGLGLDEWVEALRAVVAKPFKCKHHPNGWVKYEVGQPMGLYSSFPEFHVSNNSLANGVVEDDRRSQQMRLENLPTFPNGAQFMTVGDDIVFANATISLRYKETMKLLGVKLSESKCFEGNTSEFAGFISVSTNKSVCTFRPYKVPDKDWVSNPIQFLDALGAKLATSTFTRNKWAKQWKSFQYTRPWRDLALEPIFPTDDDRESRVAANRGDSKTLVDLCQVLTMCSDAPLPELSGIMRSSTIPLFRERGMFDFYGFNPKELTRAEKEEKNIFRKQAKRLNQDPLMRLQKSGELKEMKDFFHNTVPPVPLVDTEEPRQTLNNYETEVKREAPSFSPSSGRAGESTSVDEPAIAKEVNLRNTRYQKLVASNPGLVPRNATSFDVEFDS